MGEKYLIRKRNGRWWLLLNDFWHECRSWHHAMQLARNLQSLGLIFESRRRP